MKDLGIRLTTGLTVLASLLLLAPAREASAQSSQPRLVLFEGFYNPG